METDVSRAFVPLSLRPLAPLPHNLRSGLSAITFFALLSFLSTLTLFCLITWRIIQWRRQGKRINQFVILIDNLLAADLQQSLAFLLNARWLDKNGVYPQTAACNAQGWLLSTGDVGSGALCFLIGVHTFLSLIFDYRVSQRKFLASMIVTWFIIDLLALLPVWMHPNDIYTRAGAWCWMNEKYQDLRLWAHYFWIFSFEFGTVLIYAALYVAVQYRIKINYYANDSSTVQHARSAAKLMIVYPLVYVICTLPLATIRMVSMTTTQVISFEWYCFAGAVMVSNGWLDVALYTATRRIMLFSDDPPPDDFGIETFSLPFAGEDSKRFGTRTTCEYAGEPLKTTAMSRWLKGRCNYNDIERQPMNKIIGRTRGEKAASILGLSSSGGRPSSNTTLSSLQQPAMTAVNILDIGNLAVRTETTVTVRSEPLTNLADVREFQHMRDTGQITLSEMRAHIDARSESPASSRKTNEWVR